MPLADVNDTRVGKRTSSRMTALAASDMDCSLAQRYSPLCHAKRRQSTALGPARRVIPLRTLADLAKHNVACGSLTGTG
jgi:hypothetical protein